MYRLVKKMIVLAVVALCLGLPLSGDAAIGTEPNSQEPQTTNSMLGPLPSVSAYPGYVPGLEGNGVPFPSMSVPTSPEIGTNFYPQYVPAMPGTANMPGMMPPYQVYPGAGGTQTYQSYPGTGGTQMPLYQEPYSMNYPDSMGYPNSMEYPGMMPQGMMYPPYMQQGSADELYKQAREAYTSKDYRTALSKFHQVATWYPQSDLADNAYYWTGEIYYAWKQYPAAIQSFQTVMQSYPRGNKLPDAMLKMGYAYAEMRQYAFARSILNNVASRFSDNTRIQSLAVKKLNELNTYYY